MQLHKDGFIDCLWIMIKRGVSLIKLFISYTHLTIPTILWSDCHPSYSETAPSTNLENRIRFRLSWVIDNQWVLSHKKW